MAEEKKKNKKVYNKLSTEEISNKIKELKASNDRSKYLAHLEKSLEIRSQK